MRNNNAEKWVESMEWFTNLFWIDGGMVGENFTEIVI